MNIRSFLITVIVACVCIPMAHSQTTEDLDPDYGARFSASVDYKIVKGLHLQLEEEVRLNDNFSSFGRFHTTAGITYKPIEYLKLGVGYALINRYDASASAFKQARHRLMVDATGIYTFGNWQLSLRERLQITNRTGSFNAYQAPRNAVTLKSRLKIKYRGFRRFTPFAAVELRHFLNAPDITGYSYDEDDDIYYTSGGAKKGDAGWFLDGFDYAYLNRLRGTLGCSYKIDKHNSLTLSLLADYCIDKEVDANAEGTKLKAYVTERGFNGWVCIGYEFDF